MNNIDVFEIIRAVYRSIVELFWLIVGNLFDAMQQIGIFRGVIAVFVVCGVGYLVAHLMQRALVKSLSADPKAPVAIWQLELRYSGIGFLFFLLTLPARLVNGFVGLVGTLFKSKKTDEKPAVEGGAQGGVAKDGQDATAVEKKPEPPGPVLVASLGPSFLMAGFITAGIYIVGLLAEPLVRMQMDAPRHFPVWQYLMYGHRPELAWYLPFENFPYAEGVLSLVLWFGVWWWMGRIVRLVLGSELGRNLVRDVDRSSVLPVWRTWFGLTNLVKPDASYDLWAKWFPLVSIPFLLWSWLTVGGDPYRVDGSLFAVTAVLWVSWGLNLHLKGFARFGEEEVKEEVEREPVKARGWIDALEDMEGRFNLVIPMPTRDARKIEPLPFTKLDTQTSGVISPLLADILPPPGRLTYMQHAVLTSISLAAYVHTDPPAVERALSLKTAGGRENSGDGPDILRHRNQIVLAPESAGKSTLGLLAACNHALVHTRATLVVVRDQAAAEAFYTSVVEAVSPSTLRWNIRARKVGNDLVNDLSQGIIPDVVVCSLQQLVTQVLENSVVHAPFLENLGLIIVDDVESFCGPVEIHAQLALRRLNMRVRELLNVRDLGEEHAPMVLVLGSDMMHDMPSWVRALCGIDAVARSFSHSVSDARERESAQHARETIERQVAGKKIAATSGLGFASDEEDESSGPGLFQVFYRLADFRTALGERISAREVIESCERLAIPWHYRVCGDPYRRLGRSQLALRDEPRFFKERASQACVVLLQGSFSAVQREQERLSRAGSLFRTIEKDTDGEIDHYEPIAIITMLDPDEEMALSERNERSSLATILRDLPRPVVRPPSGTMIHRHLASDLVDHWMETGEVLEVFGRTTAKTLHELARSGGLLSETRIDVDSSASQYEKRVYVRALSRTVARAVAQASGDALEGRHEEQPAALLPARVQHVETSSAQISAVRDRTNMGSLFEIDAGSAHYVYYPGRIFEVAQGRFIVVQPSNEQASAQSAKGVKEATRQVVAEGDVYVEPFLNDDVSSPRRRVYVDILGDADGEAGFEAEPTLIGEFPLAVGLCQVRCTVDHVATYRLDPGSSEVRQRIFHTSQTQAQRDASALVTTALAIYPNPVMAETLSNQAAPMLTLEDARVVAAAAQAVLASIYRGAEQSLGLAIHVEEPEPDSDYVLGPADGLFLYDLHSGGNGSARAVHRDGVELLLRMSRLYIERVLNHDRLRANFDHWGDLAELRSERGQAVGGDAAAKQEAVRRTRVRALTWLDSRLRAEGSVSSGQITAGMGALTGSGREAGEGDVFDLGRCWYSSDGSVGELLWCKHRWTFANGQEAMIDVGFDRATVQDLLGVARRRAMLEQLQPVLFAAGEDPDLQMRDETYWGAPRVVFSREVGEKDNVVSAQELVEDVSYRAFQTLVCATAMLSWTSLKPLADLLSERALESIDAGANPPQKRAAIQTYVARFVQGIPNAALVPSTKLRPPIHALLHRYGESDTQSLLLAMLLKHCGIEAGLFVSRQEKRVLTAMSIDYPGGIEEWRRAHPELADSLLMWAELPPRPSTEERATRIYVPVETIRYQRVGEVQTAAPAEWVFIPLSYAWERIGVDNPYATDGKVGNAHE